MALETGSTSVLALPYFVIAWIIISLLIVIAGCTMITAGVLNMEKDKTSGFYGNDPNNIRKYQLVGDQSQSDRQVDAVNAMNKSSMTGSRDIPVFFQDYDYDMTLSNTGLSNSREGMTDPEERKTFKLN